VTVKPLLLLAAGATIASLGFVASSWGGPSAARGFTACTDGRGYLFVPTSGACAPGAAVSWTGDIPAVAQGAKSLTNNAIVQAQNSYTLGETFKDGGGWKRTKRYFAKCPLDYVAVGGAFNLDWPDVYGVDIVASRPWPYQGASAWRVDAVTEAAGNTPPKTYVHVTAICIARTAIFPGG